MSPDRRTMYREKELYYLLSIHCGIFDFRRDTRSTSPLTSKGRSDCRHVRISENGREVNDDAVRTLALLFRSNERRDGKRKREREVDRKRRVRISYPTATNPIERASRTATTGV